MSVERKHLAGLELALAIADTVCTDSINVDQLEGLIEQAKAAPADERKAFEAAILAANGQVPGNYSPEYDRYVSERWQGRYEGWKLARGLGI